MIAIAEEVRIGFGGHAVVVAGCDAAVAQTLLARYWAMAARAGERVAETIEVSVERDGYRCRGTHQEPFGPYPLHRFVDELEHRVAIGLVDARPDLVWLHAGAAAWEGGAVVCPAGIGGGKSTLTTRLCKAGWQYLSDEYVPFDPEAATVIAFPRMPDVRIPGEPQTMEHAVRSMPKRPVKLPRTALAQGPVRVRALVLPRFQAGAGLELRRASPAEAAFDVLRNLLNARADDARIIGHVRDLVCACPAYRLVFSEPRAAVEAVLRLMEPALGVG